MRQRYAPMIPRTTNSAARVSLGAVALTVTAVLIPGTRAGANRPSAFKITFTDNTTDLFVRGRFGLSPDAPGALVLTDNDTSLAHQFPGDSDSYSMSNAADYLWLAGDANGYAYVTWLYDEGL